MNQIKVEFKKLENVNGAKKLSNGYFADLPYCPYCETNVQNLMTHLKESH